MVHEGQIADAITQAHDSRYRPELGIRVIATELARLGDWAEAIATAGLAEDPSGRASAFIGIAESCRLSANPELASAALTESTTAAKKIRGEGWRHWRARTLAEIGLARFRLGQPDIARSMCRMALRIAESERTESQEQTIADVILAMSLIGDLQAAVAADQRLKSLGLPRRSLEKLAAALIVDRQVDAGLRLLASPKQAARFGAFLYAGRMLTRPMLGEWCDELCRNLPELDYLAVLLGRGSALQDLGRYAEAARMQEKALEISTGQSTGSDQLHKRARPAIIAEDLALNLARAADYDLAFNRASLIEDPSARNRILVDVCVCLAEAEELQAFRQSLSRLEHAFDQTRTLAIGAAAFVSSVVSRHCSREDNISALRKECTARQAAVPLIQESLQLARQLTGDEERDQALWFVAAAAAVAGLIEAATAASMIIKKLEIRHLAGMAVDCMPVVGLEQLQRD